MGVQPDAPTIETIIPLRFTSHQVLSPNIKAEPFLALLKGEEAARD
jgi:hypothetical protein